MARDYISVPISPQFVLACNKILVPGFKLHERQVLTLRELEKQFASDQFDKDIARTFWIMSDATDPIRYPSISSVASQQEKNHAIFNKVVAGSKQGKKPLNLSLDETKALFGFACVSRHEYLQGGYINAHKSLFNIFMLINSGIMVVGSREDSKYRVRRKRLGQYPYLNVCVEYDYREVECTGGLSYQCASTDEPFVMHSFNYRITEHHGKYYADMDSSQCYLKIDSVLWDSHLIPNILDRLNNPSLLTKHDVIRLVPCLCDNEVALALAKRLKQEKPSIQTMTRRLIEACYEDCPERLQAPFSLKKKDIFKLFADAMVMPPSLQRDEMINKLFPLLPSAAVEMFENMMRDMVEISKWDAHMSEDRFHQQLKKAYQQFNDKFKKFSQAIGQPFNMLHAVPLMRLYNVLKNDINQITKPLKSVYVLQDACEKYKVYMEKQAAKHTGTDKGKDILDQLRLMDSIVAESLENKHIHVAEDMVYAFGKNFDKSKKKLLLHADSKIKKIVKMIAHVVASIATLALYPAIFAFYTNKKHGSPLFWQTPDMMLASVAKKHMRHVQARTTSPKAKQNR